MRTQLMRTADLRLSQLWAKWWHDSRFYTAVCQSCENVVAGGELAPNWDENHSSVADTETS